MLADPSIDPRNGFFSIAGQPAEVTKQWFAAVGLDADGYAIDQATAAERLHGSRRRRGEKTRRLVVVMRVRFLHERKDEAGRVVFFAPT